VTSSSRIKTVQHITTDNLELTTRIGPDGKTRRQIIAEGKVHTFDDAQAQNLYSRQLEATLGATTQPG